MKRLVNGDIFSVLGEQRILSVIREERETGRVKEVMDRIVIWVPYDADYQFMHSLLEKWYRREAKAIILEKVNEFAKQMHVTYQEISIKDQKSRWGSCSSKKNLNFNWRIIMCPEPVCDYVIIHELCHLTHMNHSPNFWGLVEKYCPAYKQYKKWLKDNYEILYF